MSNLWLPYSAIAIASTSFHQKSENYGFLQLEIGLKVIIIEKFDNWFRGFIASDSKSTLGIFPQDYVFLLAIKINKSIPDNSFISIHHLKQLHLLKFTSNNYEEFYEELALVISDWNFYLGNLLSLKNYELFSKLSNLLRIVIKNRNLLCSNVLSKYQHQKITKETIRAISKGNHLGNSDLYGRDSKGTLLSLSNSFLQLYSTNMSYSIKNNSLSDYIEPPRWMHLYMNLTAFSGFYEYNRVEISFHIGNSKKETLSQNFKINVYNGNDVKQSNLSTIFVNIENKDLREDLFLFCRASFYESNGIKRPLGNGAIPLISLFKDACLKKDSYYVSQIVNIYTPQAEADWGNYHTLIKEGAYGSYKHCSRNIQIGLSVLNVTSDDLCKKHSLIANGIVFTRKINPLPENSKANNFNILIKSANFSFIRKLSGVKNVLVRIRARLFDGTFLKCIELENHLVHSAEVTVYSNNEFPLWEENVKLKLTPKEMLESHLFITLCYINKQEKGQDFAFAFLPLYQSKDLPALDGNYTLNFYKSDINTTTPAVYLNFQAGPDIISNYVLPSSSVEDLKTSAEIMSKLNPRFKDTISVAITLESALLTQSVKFFNLMNWRKLIQNNRFEMLFLQLGENEIINFYPQIFKIYFDILESNIQNYNLDTLHAHIMNALVTSISTLMDKRFNNHFERFEKESHSWTLSLRGSLALYSILEKYLKAPLDSREAKNLRAAVKVWTYIFRFMLKPFLNESSMEQGKNLIYAFLKNIALVTSHLNNDIALASQILIIQNFYQILKEWSCLFTSVELVKIASEFMKNIKSGNSKLNIYRFALMRKLLNNEIFDDAISKKRRSKLLVEWIQQSLIGEWARPATSVDIDITDLSTFPHRNEIDECVGFLLEAIPIIYSNGQCTGLIDLSTLLLSIFLKISEGKRNRDSIQPSISNTATDDVEKKNSVTLANISACLIAIIEITTVKEFAGYLSKHLKISGNEKTVEYIRDWLSVIIKILAFDIFPRSWVAVTLSARKSILNILQIIGDFGFQTFSLNSKKSQEIFHENIQVLWSDFFRAALSLIHLQCMDCKKPGLQYARISSSCKQDILREASLLIQDLWSALLSDSQSLHVLIFLIPKYAGAFFEMLLFDNNSLKETGASILFSMLLLDFKETTSFSSVEYAIFNQMSWIMEKLQDKSNSLRSIEKLELCLKNSGPNLLNREHFMTDFERLINFLRTLVSIAFEISQFSKGDQNVDENVDSMIKMIKILSSLNRSDIVNKFYHSLYDVHVENENYIEAGMLLKIYADTFCWTEFKDGEFIKEKLYMQSITVLDSGKYWERAAELCRILADEYFSKNLDYVRLSEILHLQADFMTKIVNEDRYFCNYYWVGFYGSGFPEPIRGKNYVYKSIEWEKLGSFCDRILKRYQNSCIVKAIPEENIDGRYIFVSWLDPIMDALPSAMNLPWATISQNRKSQGIQNDISDLSKTPTYALKYYQSNETNMFSSSKPIIKKQSHNEISSEISECLSLYIEKTIVYSKDIFPSISKRSQIIFTTVTEISPIENAISSISKKVQELENLYEKYQALNQSLSENSNKTEINRLSIISDGSSSSPKKKSDISDAFVQQPLNSNPFTMALNGAIDAPVNGGILLYKKAFFSSLYRETGSEMLINDLKSAIDQQILIIHSCLILHEKIVSPELRPLHEQLISLFNKNFGDDIQRINISPIRSKKTPRIVNENDSDVNQTKSVISKRATLISNNAIKQFDTADDFKIKNSKRLTALDTLLEFSESQHGPPIPSRIDSASDILLETQNSPDSVTQQSRRSWTNSSRKNVLRLFDRRSN